MLRKSLHVALTVAALLSPAAARAADEKQIIFGVIQRVVDAANNRNLTVVKADLAPETYVVDDLPPYYWSGPTAFERWQSVVAANWNSHEVVRARMTVSPSQFTDVSGDHAFAPEPASFTVEASGKVFRQDGVLAFTLVKIGSAWKVQSMVWSPVK